MNGTDDIYCTDEPNAVTVTIGGKAFENLKRITEIFNAWDENNMTPAELFAREFIERDEKFVNLSEKQPGGFGQTAAGAVCAVYGNAPDVDDLRTAFSRAGFSFQY